MKLIGSYTKKDNATNNMITTATQLDTEILRPMTDFNKSLRIDIIKELRNFSGLGLKDAKDKVDQALDWDNNTSTSNISDRNDRFLAVENLFKQYANIEASKEPVNPSTIAIEQALIGNIEMDLSAQIANMDREADRLKERIAILGHKKEALYVALATLREYKS